MVGGVSEHTRILAGVAAARGLDVHVWGPGGSAALPGVHVDDGLGGFNASDLAHTGRQLDRCPGPRRLVLQWVPHGYGRRGLNVAFSRGIARRARTGDELDVIVHEPFVDFTGGSWAQPARAVVQRYMAREILSPARRIWIAIPGWERRLRAPWLTLRDAPRVLPVPGTIPVARDAPCVLALRQRLAGGAARLVGYFGTGGEYAERALAVTVQALSRERDDVAFVCLGRGSLEVAARLARAVSGCRAAFSGTGTLALRDLSHHLQACDVVIGTGWVGYPCDEDRGVGEQLVERGDEGDGPAGTHGHHLVLERLGKALTPGVDREVVGLQDRGVAFLLVDEGELGPPWDIGDEVVLEGA
jgi:hypothetical protein